MSNQHTIDWGDYIQYYAFLATLKQSIIIMGDLPT